MSAKRSKKRRIAGDGGRSFNPDIDRASERRPHPPSPVTPFTPFTRHPIHPSAVFVSHRQFHCEYAFPGSTLTSRIPGSYPRATAHA